MHDFGAIDREGPRSHERRLFNSKNSEPQGKFDSICRWLVTVTLDIKDGYLTGISIDVQPVLNLCEKWKVSSAWWVKNKMVCLNNDLVKIHIHGGIVMENRRRAMRIPVASIAHVTPHGLDQTIDVMIRDLSTSGMGCYVNHACQKGDMMLTKIKLDLPGEDEGVLSASLMGQVVWVKALHDEKKYAIGLEFRDMEKRHPSLYAHLKMLEKSSLAN